MDEHAEALNYFVFSISCVFWAVDGWKYCFLSRVTLHWGLGVIMSHVGNFPRCFLCCCEIIGPLRELGSVSSQGPLRHPLILTDFPINILLVFGNGCLFLLFVVK